MIKPNVVLSPEDMQDKIEILIDKTSANFVLNCIVQIAHGKADHLRTNWQDENSAKQWEKLASKLETLADKPEFETL
jgi:hypothetical protein